MHSRSRMWVVAMMLTTAMVGCTWVTPTPTPLPPPSDVPAAVVAARDAALTYVAKAYPQWAPALTLPWQADDLTPAGLVGVSYYEFVNQDWRMAVNVPAVSSTQILYEIELRDEEASVAWVGKLNANLAILESNVNVAPTARTAREVILTYVRANMPEQAPPASLVWMGERTTPVSSEGQEYCSFVAADWALYLAFRPTPPDQVAYLGELYRNGTALVWRGQLDSDGTVMEIRP